MAASASRVMLPEAVAAGAVAGQGDALIYRPAAVGGVIPCSLHKHHSPGVDVVEHFGGSGINLPLSLGYTGPVSLFRAAQLNARLAISCSTVRPSTGGQTNPLPTRASGVAGTCPLATGSLSSVACAIASDTIDSGRTSLTRVWTSPASAAYFWLPSSLFFNRSSNSCGAVDLRSRQQELLRSHQLPHSVNASRTASTKASRIPTPLLATDSTTPARNPMDSIIERI